MHPMSPNRPRIGRVPAPAVNGVGLTIACGPSVRTAHPMRLGMTLERLGCGLDEPRGTFSFRALNQTASDIARRAGRTAHPMRAGMARVSLKRMGLL